MTYAVYSLQESDRFMMYLPSRSWHFAYTTNMDSANAQWKPTEDVAIFLENDSTDSAFYFVLPNKDNSEWIKVVINMGNTANKKHWLEQTPRVEQTLTGIKDILIDADNQSNNPTLTLHTL